MVSKDQEESLMEQFSGERATGDDKLLFLFFEFEIK